MSFPTEFQLDHINLDEFPLMIGRDSKEGIVITPPDLQR